MATNTTTGASVRSYSLLIRILVTIRILVSYSYLSILVFYSYLLIQNKRSADLIKFFEEGGFVKFFYGAGGIIFKRHVMNEIADCGARIGAGDGVYRFFIPIACAGIGC